MIHKFAILLQNLTIFRKSEFPLVYSTLSEDLFTDGEKGEKVNELGKVKERVGAGG